MSGCPAEKECVSRLNSGRHTSFLYILKFEYIVIRKMKLVYFT